MVGAIHWHNDRTYTSDRWNIWRCNGLKKVPKVKYQHWDLNKVEHHVEHISIENEKGWPL